MHKCYIMHACHFYNSIFDIHDCLNMVVKRHASVRLGLKHSETQLWHVAWAQEKALKLGSTLSARCAPCWREVQACRMCTSSFFSRGKTSV